MLLAKDTEVPYWRIFGDYSDDICGVVVSVRAKGDKIAIWTTECENREAVTYTRRVHKERLHFLQR